MKKTISNKFYDGGIILDFKNTDPFKKILIIKKYFKKYGILIIKNFKMNPKKLKEFTNNFSLSYSNDASRRKIRYDEKNIRSVDIGNHEIPLHSESSFTNTCPEIMWFYAVSVEKKNSTPTTICDGIKVWENLPLKFKERFLFDPLIFKVSVNLPYEKRSNNSKKWYIDSIGMKNPIINFKKSKLNFEFTKYAINYDSETKKISFCNHILSVNDEDQIKSCNFFSKKKFNKTLIQTIKNITNNYTYDHKWQNNQLIILNNKRFLHGRRAISVGEKRDIVNIQTLVSNF